MIYHLKRKIYETYEYEYSKILEALAKEYGKPSVEQFLSEVDVDEQIIINLFEKHNGSQYGEDLFPQVDFDIGYDLNQYPDDSKEFVGERQ